MLTKLEEEILELCSEDLFGSWELWSKTQPETMLERGARQREFLHAIQRLVELGLIEAFHHGPLAATKRVTTKVVFDMKRLEFEIDHSMNETGLDPDTYYWFYIAPEGEAALQRIWARGRAH